jgi:hypothetical protein
LKILASDGDSISAHKAGTDFVNGFPCAPAVSRFVPE